RRVHARRAGLRGAVGRVRASAGGRVGGALAPRRPRAPPGPVDHGRPHSHGAPASAPAARAGSRGAPVGRRGGGALPRDSPGRHPPRHSHRRV
ncbi:MAG: hypothetical protein AVDCRST_MAG89-1589, partial [uncultured Gemmatimonadetes bacterium]